MDRVATRTLGRSRGLLRPSPAKQLLLPSASAGARAGAGARALSTAVPRIAEVSFWKSLVPKPLRRENRQARRAKAPGTTSWMDKEWNPATFFIVIFLLIGSMSIQMISLRNSFDAFMRRADVRIGLLREVVEKIQNGEEVDVEKVLGSGDPEREVAWEEVLDEIEKENAARNQKKQDKPKTSEGPSSTAKIVPVPESKTDVATTQEPPKGRTADFF